MTVSAICAIKTTPNIMVTHSRKFSRSDLPFGDMCMRPTEKQRVVNCYQKTVCCSYSFDLYLTAPENNSAHRITIKFTKNRDNSIRLIPTYIIYLYSYNNAVLMFVFLYLFYLSYICMTIITIYKIHIITYINIAEVVRCFPNICII